MSLLAVDSTLIPIVAIGGAFVAGPIILIAAAVRSVAIHRAKEQTKRELAAYVAEGTMDPDTAVALANAGATGDADDLK